MLRANLSQVVLLAYTFQQQAQDTGQDAHQLLHEWINNELTAQEALALKYDFSFWARPNQLPPDGDWTVWMIMGGRGSGKTRPGAEWILQKEREGCRRMALVAETENDGRKIMVEGPSGLLACAPPHNRPEYHPEKRELIWRSGARADLFSGDSPDQLPGHAFDAAWADEVAKWKYPEEAYTHLDLALREGDDAQCVITTTPRPLAFLRNLKKDPDCVTVQATTYDNAPYLAAKFIKRIKKYDGTVIGQQEIDGELLEDIQGALWTLSQINETRIRNPADAPEYARIVIGVDPQGKEAANNIWIPDKDRGSETGIVVCGEGRDGRGYVLDDLSGDHNPNGWGKVVEDAYHQHGADRIVAEANNGGEMVRHTIYTVDPNLPVEIVRASEGKKARAEPVSALYEQGKVSHVGNFAKLEDEMCHYTGKGKQSPNRLDALVWALTELFLTPKNDPMSHFDPEKHESPPQKTKLRGAPREHWSERPPIFTPE